MEFKRPHPLLIALVVAVLAVAPSLARAGRPCGETDLSQLLLDLLGEGRIARFRSLAPAAARARLDRMLATGRWRNSAVPREPAFSTLSPQLKEILATLSSLGPERAGFLDSLRRGPDRPLGKWLRLALHDELAWRAYVESISMSGSSEFSPLDSLRPAIQSMPGDLRRRLYELSLSRLGGAGKSPFGESQGPKRGLGILLRALGQTDQRISALLSEHAPVEAFSQYFRTIQSELRAADPASPAYSPENVLSVVRTIQGYLKTHRTELSGLDSGPPRVVLYGSFPNALARPGRSDIDIMISDGALVPHMPAIRAAVGNAFGPMANPSPIAKQGYFGLVQTLMIEITPERVRLLVFPARTSPLGLERAAEPVPYDLW